jgi:putative NADPH-quinone reductase
MTRKICIIQAHPDPSPERLCRALADAYAEGAKTGGHLVTRIDLATVDFPLLRSKEEFEHGGIPPSLVPAQKAILDAEHVVIVFPIWLGTMPALLKGFLEQVMRPGIAFSNTETEGALPKTLLSGRSARLIMTIGMPAFFYKYYYLAHGLRGLRRNILSFVGFKPIKQSLFGMVEGVSNDTRQNWLEEMQQLGMKGD